MSRKRNHVNTTLVSICTAMVFKMMLLLNVCPQMESLGALPISAPTVSSPFTSTLSSLGVTPGSPAKLIPTLGQTSLGPTCPAPAFNPVQSLTNQLQGGSRHDGFLVIVIYVLFFQSQTQVRDCYSVRITTCFRYFHFMCRVKLWIKSNYIVRHFVS